jgi:hypothetical protein
MSLSIITNDIHNKNPNQSLDLCRRIPLLEDVFKICSNVHINLDIKIDNDELIFKVCFIQKKKKFQFYSVTCFSYK